MADKKISALTAASVPLVGTEVLPIVQGGSTVKVSVGNLTAGRDVANKTSSVQSGVSGGSFLNLSDAGTAASRYWKMQNDVSAFGDWGIYQSTDNTGAAYTARLYFDAAGNPTVSTGNLVVGTAGKGIDFSANTHAAGMTSELLNWYEEGVFTPTWNGGTVTTNSSFYTRVGRLVTWIADISFGTSASSASSQLTLPFTAGGTWGSGSFNYNEHNTTATINVDASSNRLLFRSAANAGNLLCTDVASKRFIFVATYFA